MAIFCNDVESLRDYVINNDFVQNVLLPFQVLRQYVPLLCNNPRIAEVNSFTEHNHYFVI